MAIPILIIFFTECGILDISIQFFGFSHFNDYDLGYCLEASGNVR
jgi:hypothetical protein